MKNPSETIGANDESPSSLIQPEPSPEVEAPQRTQENTSIEFRNWLNKQIVEVKNMYHGFAREAALTYHSTERRSKLQEQETLTFPALSCGVAPSCRAHHWSTTDSDQLRIFLGPSRAQFPSAGRRA
jgi:hypothetical protein